MRGPRLAVSAMAAATARDQSAKKIPLFPLVSLLCFASIFLLLSLSRRASLSPQPFQYKPDLRSGSCDYSDGAWIYDLDARPRRYDTSCKEIYKGWNCIANNKSNAREILKWRWQPKGSGCNLPPFDPAAFLETHRDISIVQDLLATP